MKTKQLFKKLPTDLQKLVFDFYYDYDTFVDDIQLLEYKVQKLVIVQERLSNLRTATSDLNFELEDEDDEYYFVLSKQLKKLNEFDEENLFNIIRMNTEVEKIEKIINIIEDIDFNYLR